MLNSTHEEKTQGFDGESWAGKSQQGLDGTHQPENRLDKGPRDIRAKKQRKFLISKLNAGLCNQRTEFPYEIILSLFYILLVAHHKICPLFP